MSIDWMAMDEPLKPKPEFYVEPPDGLKNVPEIKRQTELFRIMKMARPKVLGFPIPNAGKRNPMKARQEGIMAGVFDTQWIFPSGMVCFVEMKGYDSSGRAGKLSNSQIDFGNNLVRLNISCGCFFSAVSAYEWLLGQEKEHEKRDRKT